MYYLPRRDYDRATHFAGLRPPPVVKMLKKFLNSEKANIISVIVVLSYIQLPWGLGSGVSAVYGDTNILSKAGWLGTIP